MPDWHLHEMLSSETYRQYALGGACHPQTGLWQLWITLDGEHIYWIAAYHHKDKIEAAREYMREQLPTGESWNRESIQALFNQLYQESEAEPQTMPAQVEMMIRLNYVWR